VLKLWGGGKGREKGEQKERRAESRGVVP